jgi:hypothetical protein
MSRAGEELAWPLFGMLGPQSTRDRVFLHHSNRLLHDGMTLLIEDAFDSVREVAVARYAPGSLELVLAEALEFDPAGCRYMLKERPASRVMSEWQEYDILPVLSMLYTETTKVQDRAWRYATLSTPDIPLTEASPLSDIHAAWVEFRAWLEVLRQRAVELNLIGNETAAALERQQQFCHIVMVLASTYEVILGEKHLEMAVVLGGASASDAYVNPWWYSSESGTDDDHDNVGIMTFLLAQAHREGIRKRGDIIYEEVMKTSQVWTPKDDNPRCCAPDCDEYATYGKPVRNPLRSEFDYDVDVDDDEEDASNGVEERKHAEKEDDVEDDDDDVDVVARRQYCFAHSSDVLGVVDLRYGSDGKLLPGEYVERTFNTKAFRPKMQTHGVPWTITNWIHATLDATTRRSLWKKFIANYNSILKMAEGYLRQGYDSSFPTVVPNRRYISFSNGMYNFWTNTFYTYGEDALPDVCSVNFVDLPFDVEWTRMPLNHAAFDVDGYSDIVESQNYDADMKCWLDVFFGRLFFPIGEFDGWEKLMVIKGWAATGKSTIAKGIAKLLGEVNIGYVASNCEEQWALASVHDKLLWMCLELKSNFRLPTGTMQSMASGEVVVVNEKHKTAFDKVWTIQGLLVGNELPLAWTTDAMNALVRRVVPFPFDLPPVMQDSTVSSRFMANIPKFLVRVTRMYLAKCAELGSRPIDGVLPARLREASDEFKKRAAPLFRFLDEASGGVGDYDMATLDQRIVILYYLLFDKKVSAVALSVDKAAIEREYNALSSQTHKAIGNPELLLQTYHVPMDDLKASFRQWMQVSGELAKNIPNIQLQENYKPSARDFKLGVATGVRVGQKEIKTPCWFGIRKNSSGDGGPMRGDGVGYSYPSE